MCPVSLPEKTLEHWASQYVLFRFRSKAQVWWPAFGTDVDIRSLPSRPGKALYLELKTATVTKSGHEVQIDIVQLSKYASMPRGRQPFYVLPLPMWEGELDGPDAAIWRQPLPAPELAFTRAGATWFGHWTVVLTADAVKAVLADELSPLPPTAKQVFRTLVTIDRRTLSLRWANNPGPPPTMIRWRPFWNEVRSCGRSHWPQQFLLEQSEVGDRQTLDYSVVAAAIRRSTDYFLAIGESDHFLLEDSARPAPDGKRRLPPVHSENLPSVPVSLFELGADGSYHLRKMTPQVQPEPSDIGDGNRMAAFVDATGLRVT